MARARSHVLPSLLLLAGLITILSSRILSFSMSKGMIQQNRKMTKAPNLHPRGGQPKNPIEDPLEEEEEEELPAVELPPYRAPFRVSLSQLGQAHLSDHNLEYIQRKMLHALEHFEDHIQDVQIHVSQDPHHHKPAEVPGDKSKKRKMKQISAGGDDDEGEIVEERMTKGGVTKQLLAPFRIDVKVDMKEGGKPIVVGRHAQDGMATLLAACDHTYDCLKNSMGKEKSKLMTSLRKQKDSEEAHPWEEDDEGDFEAEYEAKLDEEAAKSYAA